MISEYRWQNICARLVAHDLDRPKAHTNVHHVFDLDNSGGSDIARDKDAMIAEAVDSSRRKRRFKQ